MAASKRLLRCLAPIAIVVLATNAPRALSAPSLYVVDDGSDATVGALLAQGLMVSSRTAQACFVFGGAEVADAAARLGHAARLLDPDVAGWEHFRVDGAPERALPECRVIHAVGDTWIVAVPAGRSELALGLGHSLMRLFQRPIRLPRVTAAPALPRSAAAEASIAALVAQVSEESLAMNVFWLESFGTRNAKKAGGLLAAEWLAARFRGFGIEQVEIQTWSSTYSGNVVATLPGTETPDAIYVLGGHYDSIVHETPGDFEPGADDNASGTATVLEVARVLASQHLGATVRFVAFGGEEWGLFGSEAHAAQAAAMGENILGMVNFDMVGYLAPGDRRDLDIITNDANNASDWLMQTAFTAAATYVPDLRVVRGKMLIGRSDHESFWDHGFSAIFFFEDSTEPSPFLHTTSDITGISYNDSFLHAQSTRTAVALAATLAGVPAVPVTLQSFAAARQGASVRLVWQLEPGAVRALAGIEVERAARTVGPWERCGEGALAPEVTDFVDGGAGNAAAWYRLVLVRPDGGRAATPALEVAGALVRTDLSRVYEAGGEVHVHFRVGSATPRLFLGVYDVRGRLLRVLSDSPRDAGEYLLVWNRRDAQGAAVARGVYVVALRTEDASTTRKVALVER